MPTPCTKWGNLNQGSCFQVLQVDVKIKRKWFYATGVYKND